MGPDFFDAYFDGELSPETEAEFRTWLRADSEHMREFVRYAHMHRALRDEFKGRGERRAVASEKPARGKTVWNWRWWSAAGIVLMGAGYFVYLSLMSDPGLTIFTARIESVSGSVSRIDQEGSMRMPARAKDYVNAKAALEFESPGHAALKYQDGTALDFAVKSNQGAIRLSWPETKPRLHPARKGKRLTLESGVLSATVPPQPDGEPLIIHTPVAEVTVVGTQFKVESAGSWTRLDVTTGKVRIVRFSDQAGADVSASEFIIVSSAGSLVVKHAEASMPGAQP